MSKLNARVCIILLAGFTASLFSVTSGRSEDAVKFSGDDLLAMSPEQQSAWVGASVLTVAHMMSLSDETGPAADCIYEWYFGDVANAQGRIFGHIRQNPDHYPTVIIFAVIDRECGGLRQPIRDRS